MLQVICNKLEEEPSAIIQQKPIYFIKQKPIFPPNFKSDTLSWIFGLHFIMILWFKHP